MRKPKARKVAALALLCLLACAGCDQAAAPSEPAEEAAALRVVTSFYPMYLLTANVAAGVEGVSVRNMAAPEVGCLHDYQLLPGDLRALEDADALVINGAGMEPFLDKVRAQRPRLPVIEASEGIALLEDEADGDHGHDHEENPHVWVDPRNAAAQTRVIARRLGEIDPANAAAYFANAEAYGARLEALYVRMREQLDGLGTRELFTFHEAFAYFAAAFDFHIAGVIEREPGTEPGTRDLIEIVDRVRAGRIPALFVEPQYPGRVAGIIARETGAKVCTLDPVVTGPLELTAYEDAMERNLQALLDALR